MVFRIVIAGKSQCELFAEVCFVADHLAQNLPNFCYERIEKPVLEWKVWLCKVNQKNKWHHKDSPLIWKELLHKGSKPHYIGTFSDFFDFCYSYYKFDRFISSETFKGLVDNYKQYQKKVHDDNEKVNNKLKEAEFVPRPDKSSYVVCISGAGCPLSMHIISGLLNISYNDKYIRKIFIYDDKCNQEFMEFIERQCSHVGTSNAGGAVKLIEKIGRALTSCDMLIILDHVPLKPGVSIGEWLHANKVLMRDMALTINASGSRRMYILIPNVGPACYNATMLMKYVTDINKRNIVVVSSDLGLEIAPVAAEIAEIPLKNMFCPPVWGFVGINHLVDIRTTIHKYNSFEPYNRYTKVKNSTLNIGSLTPEMRTMEYLMFFDETLWTKVTENKTKTNVNTPLCKAVAVVNTAKIWLFDPNPDYIVNLGVLCNGAFGLTFKGCFSQPSRLKKGQWWPATDFTLPKEPQIKINYLEDIAKRMMTLHNKELPELIPYYPCTCKPRLFKKKGVW